MGRTTEKLLKKLEEWLKALRGEGKPEPVPVPVDRGKGPRSRSMMVLLPLIAIGCQITDHSEKEITPEMVQFPASGYEKVDEKDLPRIEFEETHFDMGQIVQGNKVSREFHFTNTGKSALILTDVRGSCGCTVGKEWPKDPIKPGEKGTIEVQFDSEGRSGRQEKTVTVVSNATPPTTVLTIAGEVMGPANVQPVE